MSSDDDVTLEEVTSAEAVLSRLIHEKRVLDDVASVLQTYRLIKSQSAFATSQLATLEQQVKDMEQYLEELEGEKKRAMEQASLDTEEHRKRVVMQTEAAIAHIEAQRDEAQLVLNNVVKAASDATVSYERQMEEQSASLNQTQQLVDQLKAQYTRLASAINQAALQIPQGIE